MENPKITWAWNHKPLKIEGKTSTIVWKTHFDTLLFNENLQV